MYFQAVYILGNFWQFWFLLSGFVKANLAFGLIYFIKVLNSLRIVVIWISDDWKKSPILLNIAQNLINHNENLFRNM